MNSHYSAVHLSKIMISKSFTHLLYSDSSNFKNISMGNFQIRNFLATPVLLNNFISHTGKMERYYYETQNNLVFYFYDGNFTETHPDDISSQGKGDCCGGAICIREENHIICKNVLFLKCSANIQGGAIKVYRSYNLTILNCTFQECSTVYENDDGGDYNSHGAALCADNTQILSISDTKFLQNKVSKQYHKYFACVALFNCEQTSINGNTEFDNNPNIGCDIYFDFNYIDTSPFGDNDKTVFISRCCFKTKLDNAIKINEDTTPDQLKLANFVCTGCSFQQKEYNFNSLYHIITESVFNTKTNYLEASYCMFSDRFTPSELFTLTSYFSSTLDFSSSTDFTTSAMFSNSQAFTTSDIFTPSQEHPETDPFTQSDDFSSSGDFSESGDFTESGPFTQSNVQSTECFSSSDRFTFSDGFSLSSAFTQSSGFAAMAKGVKLSSGGIAGIVIACLVLLAIIILLLVLFLRRKKSAFIPPEDDPMNIDGLDIPINMYD